MAHGCGAKTFPMRCQPCKKEVFYFSCNCGSKVVVSELGGSWTIRRYPQGLISEDGKAFVEYGMAVQTRKHVASELKSPIERRYEEAVRRGFQRQKNGGDKWTKRVEPGPGLEFADASVLHHVIPPVSVAEKLHLDRTAIGRAFLGALGKGSFGQITVHIGLSATVRVIRRLFRRRSFTPPG